MPEESLDGAPAEYRNWRGWGIGASYAFPSQTRVWIVPVVISELPECQNAGRSIVNQAPSEPTTCIKVSRTPVWPTCDGRHALNSRRDISTSDEIFRFGISIVGGKGDDLSTRRTNPRSRLGLPRRLSFASESARAFRSFPARPRR